MAPKFIPFEKVEELANIEQIAQMLNLSLRAGKTQLRCVCPVHGGDDRTLCISPNVRSRRGSLGVFYCQAVKEGGDRIALAAHCMEMGQQDAAFFIAQQYGMDLANSETVDSGTVTSTTVSKEHATAPPAQQKASTSGGSTPPKFDPVKFWDHCTYSDEVKSLGISEEDAARVLIGWHTRYKALFIGCRNPDGGISGFIRLLDPQQVKLPPQWLPQSAEIVPLRRPA
ncbi:hypothetical protein [Rhodoplanes sp. Z2-YC6860]|uniref:hypothetical protein n=1 Tax=Rhodoplanes sp. Z2-YC6860 TaxID=674703 RepID=UPI00078CE09D|nr:hypothetical protein [Rhodoplanes sp. Z2-YC6860]AMN44713.1 hypothetical protein RHPLAN_63040 [Rhodoplanes sp. Z2-YC6860]